MPWKQMKIISGRSENDFFNSGSSITSIMPTGNLIFFLDLPSTNILPVFRICLDSFVNFVGDLKFNTVLPVLLHKSLPILML